MRPPGARETGSLKARAPRSFSAPGDQGTTKRTGRSGQAGCASAGTASGRASEAAALHAGSLRGIGNDASGSATGQVGKARVASGEEAPHDQVLSEA